jgi:dihydroxyacid dehydratase/phosphogluconate dehydratase
MLSNDAGSSGCSSVMCMGHGLFVPELGEVEVIVVIITNEPIKVDGVNVHCRMRQEAAIARKAEKFKKSKTNILNIKKFKTKNLGVHKMCVYMPCNFHNQIQNT